MPDTSEAQPPVAWWERQCRKCVIRACGELWPWCAGFWTAAEAADKQPCFYPTTVQPFSPPALLAPAGTPDCLNPTSQRTGGRGATVHRGPERWRRPGTGLERKPSKGGRGTCSDQHKETLAFSLKKLRTGVAQEVWEWGVCRDAGTLQCGPLFLSTLY